MKSALLLSSIAFFGLAASAAADVTGVYTTRYSDTSADQGQSVTTTTVIDVYVSSDDGADTVLGVENFSLSLGAQVIYFQSASEPAFPTNTWWLPKNSGGVFDLESVRRSDSFVTIGGVDQNVLRPEQSPGVGEGQRLADDFANPFDAFYALPQQNSGGWWNGTPETLAGRVGPVALAGPDGEPSGFGRGLFIGRFTYYGDFSLEGTTLDVVWNQGPGTESRQASFTIPPVELVDCNNDGIDDAGQIADGTLDDLDMNGVPDCCDEGIICGSCPGDIDGDGVVDAFDLCKVLAVWNSDGSTVSGSDIDGDGVVGQLDLAYVLGYWGVCP